jgi:hypothetical protein
MNNFFLSLNFPSHYYELTLLLHKLKEGWTFFDNGKNKIVEWNRFYLSDYKADIDISFLNYLPFNFSLKDLYFSKISYIEESRCHTDPNREAALCYPMYNCQPLKFYKEDKTNFITEAPYIKPLLINVKQYHTIRNTTQGIRTFFQICLHKPYKYYYDLLLPHRYECTKRIK